MKRELSREYKSLSNAVLFCQNPDVKKPAIACGLFYLAPSTGLEPVTYGLAVRQAFHKVLPTERRGSYLEGTKA
ncbi:hypothetical protein C0W54_22115 [Photobacterium kishitanii]|nr:hypothetical protein C0W54_22115 [Photobacterium kishitanii]